MKRYRCNQCILNNSLPECIIDWGDAPPPKMCPCDGHNADWYEIKPEPLPKLTVEALAERGIEWPEWAVCAFVFPLGFAHFCSAHVCPRSASVFVSSQNKIGEYWIACDAFKVEQIPGKWDGSDWRNSMILRPEQWVPFTRETLPKLPFVVHDKKCSRNAITTVSAASDDFVWLSGANGETEYKELFEDFEMEDGSPCGVKK